MEDGDDDADAGADADAQEKPTKDDHRHRAQQKLLRRENHQVHAYHLPWYSTMYSATLPGPFSPPFAPCPAASQHSTYCQI